MYSLNLLYFGLMMAPCYYFSAYMEKPTDPDAPRIRISRYRIETAQGVRAFHPFSQNTPLLDDPK